MGTGYITVQTRTADDGLPVRAHVTITHADGTVLYETDTDGSGNTEKFVLTAPDDDLTLDPNYTQPAYSVCDVNVYAQGYTTVHVHDVEIVDTQTAILPVHMEPEENPGSDHDIDFDIGPVGLLDTTPRNPVGGAAPFVLRDVVIPDSITVHLGTPTNTAARNVHVKFPEYIKNVASSEIYSTWPHNSLVANIHAIVTFALNRVYTEWYRSRGFNFDITNSTAYDQYYRDGGPIYENISQIVDGIFNIYARRFGFQNPFFTQFCNGTTVTCPGLSQWGTVSLANQGMTPLQILHYYYPNDLELVTSNNITGITESFPGTALTLGNQGAAVLKMQNYLNRIRVNFPLIPQVTPDGVFGSRMQEAVRTFQRSFNLTPDGVIGRDTWNKISFIYVGVTRLGELDGEGDRIGIGQNPPNVVLSQGSRGENVIQLQFILDRISPFYQSIPTVIKDGVFGADTKNAVIEFQKTFNLTQDGIVGPGTWNKLYSVYRGIIENAPVPENPPPPPELAPAYPGYTLTVGSTGPNVRLIQTYLNTIRIVYPSIPYLTVDGMFGQATRNAVIAFQREFVLTPDGVVGPVTWNKIMEQFLLATGNTTVSLEYPGVPLRIGSTGSDVRLMQTFLMDLRAKYPTIPEIAIDGIFGANTQAAVIAFQRLLGLAPDGVIGPVTWNAIVTQRQ